MTQYEELVAENTALQRRVWELEYQLQAALIVYGLTSFPSPPPRLFTEPAASALRLYEAAP